MKFLILLTIAVFVLSCKQTSTEPQSSETPSLQEVSRISITQSGYDTLTVQSKEDFILADSNLTMVQIGYYWQDTLQLICEQAPQYTEVNDRQRVQFKMSFSVDAGTLYLPLAVRYVFKGCKQLEIDSTVVMCHYPYVTSEVVLRWADINDESHIYINDFDLRGEYLYYLNRISHSVYEYNLNDGGSRMLFKLGEANFLCADSDFVFLTAEHDGIYRYDLRTDSLKKIVSFYYTPYFGGIVAATKRLYADQYDTKLHVYDYDGNPLETISGLSTFLSLGIDQNIIYSVYFNHLLSRYDLDTGSKLDSRPLPTANTNAIKVHNGYLYFTDKSKDFLGRVPLADVESFSKSAHGNGVRK